MKPTLSKILKEHKAKTTEYMTYLKSIKNLTELLEEELNAERLKLVTQISRDYNLNYCELERKYIKNKKEGHFVEPLIVNTGKINVQLHKIMHNNDAYFIELRDGGGIYDEYNVLVGKLVGGDAHINEHWVKTLKSVRNTDFDMRKFSDINNYQLLDEHIRYNIFSVKNNIC